MKAEEDVDVQDSNGVIETTPPPVEKPVNGDKEKQVEPRTSKCSKRAAKEQALLLKKKDERSMELVKKALTGMSTPEEKLAVMFEKYSELLEDNRKLLVSLKAADRKSVQLQREKEVMQAEHSKIILTRSRLESLCRELQRQNKAVKDESLGRIRDEEEKRKELSARFNVTLNDITALMQQNTEKNNKLRDENKDLADKFKVLCEQYDLREQQVEKLLKQNQLENKLSETKLAKTKVEMMEEKELLLREVTGYQMQIQEMQKNETALRTQITMYSEKYDEFQQALGKSNDVFSSFKTEMDKMSKKICRLEKETTSWKSRWEKSHQALLEMAADKQQREEEMGVAARQMVQLQRLCRTLQEERTKHIARLRELGETVSKPELPVVKSEESSVVKVKPSTKTPTLDALLKESTEIPICNEPEDSSIEVTDQIVQPEESSSIVESTNETVDTASCEAPAENLNKNEQESQADRLKHEQSKTNDSTKQTSSENSKNIEEQPDKDLKNTDAAVDSSSRNEEKVTELLKENVPTQDESINQSEELDNLGNIEKNDDLPVDLNSVVPNPAFDVPSGIISIQPAQLTNEYSGGVTITELDETSEFSNTPEVNSAAENKKKQKDGGRKKKK